MKKSSGETPQSKTRSAGEGLRNSRNVMQRGCPLALSAGLIELYKLIFLNLRALRLKCQPNDRINRAIGVPIM
jgi:hypothetical protein